MTALPSVVKKAIAAKMADHKYCRRRGDCCDPIEAELVAFAKVAYAAGRKAKWREYQKGGCAWAVGDKEFT